MFLKTHTSDLNSLLYLKDSPIVIIEYVPHGDLLGYLSRGVLDNYWLPELVGYSTPLKSNPSRPWHQCSWCGLPGKLQMGCTTYLQWRYCSHLNGLTLTRRMQLKIRTKTATIATTTTTAEIFRELRTSLLIKMNLSCAQLCYTSSCTFSLTSLSDFTAAVETNIFLGRWLNHTKQGMLDSQYRTLEARNRPFTSIGHVT